MSQALTTMTTLYYMALRCPGRELAPAAGYGRLEGGSENSVTDGKPPERDENSRSHGYIL